MPRDVRVEVTRPGDPDAYHHTYFGYTPRTVAMFCRQRGWTDRANEVWLLDLRTREPLACKERGKLRFWWRKEGKSI